MRTIAHLSDLHFGTEILAVVDGLAHELHTRLPSLVVISGDLTQRARRAQFAAARSFLARLPRPQLIVPGNHDVPLYDLARRFFAPLARYRHYICAELNPLHCDAEVCAIGLNTARSLTWKSGRISAAQIARLRAHLQHAGPRLKVIVTHHPFVPPPDDVGIKLVGRAGLAIPLFDAHQADLLLAGHLHRGYAADIRAHYQLARRSVLAAQAGTATSGRTRHEPNAYNWIQLEAERITIEVRSWSGRGFTTLRTARYARSPEGWTPEP
ncbi:metallophosphoesterase family protein [Opitutus terrae]|uniref:Metallophosphoesterase n=1 Tax=Opitutus terrae (strain DSM 11246 / JCM 15787 / PB90-1) TaxID=452637 RepID=B1ZZA0_OPITP|nr:metallophosphoesterase [Opitutus terrae]ACB77175.1 metallophosphoesterase [Opitutus terrae PB90-1]